jgi:hypothetical protein
LPSAVSLVIINPHFSLSMLPICTSFSSIISPGSRENDYENSTCL